MPIAERIMCQSALESMASHPPLSPRLQLAVIVNDSLEGLMGMRPYWVKDQDITVNDLLARPVIEAIPVDDALPITD
ncbi:hypothetical protein K443DRAFT_12418 [Laccaria amethystina LaAM-08-1]|uniref:Uncharacterized protein n=1 Tax=Laccaria amethystina LaAM-08-1 TaxID=1095629 RepID=A0A0C9WYN6_9AGAR|nr:hypothetical protein K443DRAFT_12418 [Laccaria amethystina LaAM-08-1]